MLMLMLMLAGTLAAGASPYSSMWGLNGASYAPVKDGGRLLDWSYAGYNAGESPLPSPPATHELKDFGAQGNGVADDTLSFAHAFDAMSRGACTPKAPCVLHIPCGRYVVKQGFRVASRSIILRGDGPHCTDIIVASPLGAASVFQFWGLIVDGDRTKLTDVVGTAPRGANTIQVASTSGMAAGQWVIVIMGGPEGGGDHFAPLHMGLDPGCTDVSFCNDDKSFMHFTRVARVVDSVTLQTERPLPWGMYATFTPKTVHAYRPRASNGGVEGLSIRMRSRRYLGHFRETGYNAIKFTGVVNHFVRDVRIYDADLGVTVSNSAFVTLRDISLHGSAARECVVDAGGACKVKETGHHGIVASGVDNLITNFTFATRFVHDITMAKMAHNSVVSDGKAVMMAMDHHKGENHGTLWTNVSLGTCTRPFSHGGCPACGLAAGPYTTFWNVACTSPSAPTALDGHQLAQRQARLGVFLNFVGNLTKFPATPLNRLQESWVQEHVDLTAAPNLHMMQAALRFRNFRKVSTRLGGLGKGGKTLVQSSS